MKNIRISVIGIVAVLLLAFNCGRQNDRLQTGDLIFVGLPVGYDAETGSVDEAIASATGGDGDLNLIHVAIAEVKADSIWIIDATIALSGVYCQAGERSGFRCCRGKGEGLLRPCL